MRDPVRRVHRLVGRCHRGRDPNHRAGHHRRRLDGRAGGAAGVVPAPARRNAGAAPALAADRTRPGHSLAGRGRGRLGQGPTRAAKLSTACGVFVPGATSRLAGASPLTLRCLARGAGRQGQTHRAKRPAHRCPRPDPSLRAGYGQRERVQARPGSHGRELAALAKGRLRWRRLGWRTTGVSADRTA